MHAPQVAAVKRQVASRLRQVPVSHLQDPSRVVLVVGDGAVALSALHHDRRLEARVGDRRGAILAALDELVDLRVALVLVLELASLASAEVEEPAADEGADDDNADDDTGCDAGR